MKVEIDTHTHTLISGHAYNTIREMASMASGKGLKALAITEHAPGMKATANMAYFQNLKVVPRQMYGIELFLGAELNIMDETGKVDLPDKVLAELDIVIASMHTVCYQGERTKEAVTEAYLNVLEKGCADIIGHPDDGRFPVDYDVLARKAKEAGTLLELNNSSLSPKGFRVNTWENARIMLENCKKYGTMVALSSDAHVDTAIAEYGYAEQLLKEAKFPEELIANRSLEEFRKRLKG